MLTNSLIPYHLSSRPKRERFTPSNGSRPYPDRLDVDELLDSIRPELAAEARALHAPKREPRVGGDHSVDENKSRLDAFRQLLGALDVGGPDGRAEPEVGVVGDSQRVLGVLDPDHGGDWTERLLVVGRHSRAHVGEHRRLEVVTTSVAEALASGQRASAEAHRLAHLALPVVDEVGAGQRPDLGGAVHR